MAESNVPETDPAGTLPPEVAEKIPPEVRSQIQAWLTTIYAGGPRSSIAEKITSTHISDAIANANRMDERHFEYAKDGRKFQAMVFLVTMGFVVFVVVFFKQAPEVFAPVLSAVLGFAAGFGMGKRQGPSS